MIKGLIFDLDGTLIDSIADITTSANIAISKYGYDKQSEDFVRKNTGKGFRRLIKDMLPIDTSDELIDEITTCYTVEYGNHYMEKTSAYQGIHELLQLLQKDGIKIAVNSNKKNIYTENLMKKIFPNINFVATIGERNNIPNKPDPTTALEITKLMNLNINEVAYVGDSEVDMKTGHNANMITIACLWGFRSKEVLLSNNPTIIVNKPIDIYNYVKQTGEKV